MSFFAFGYVLILVQLIFLKLRFTCSLNYLIFYYYSMKSLCAYKTKMKAWLYSTVMSRVLTHVLNMEINFFPKGHSK